VNKLISNIPDTRSVGQFSTGG